MLRVRNCHPAADPSAAQFFALEDRFHDALVILIANLLRFEQRCSHRADHVFLLAGVQIRADRLATYKVRKLHRFVASSTEMYDCLLMMYSTIRVVMHRP